MEKTLRVLVIEDSDDDTQLAIRALKKGGYEPLYERVEDTEAMRKALEKGPWDVILCDYQMPKFTGLAAIALLKEMGLDIPLIIVSGIIGEEMAAECMRLGAHDFFMKNNLTRLSSAVNRELKEAESRAKRRQAEVALRESEDKFKYFFEHSSIGKSITYLSGKMEANNAFNEMLGYSPDEFKKCKWQDVTHPDDVEKSQHVVDLLISGSKDSERFTKRYIHKNGSVVWTEIDTTLRRDKDGHPLYIMSSISDITERRRYEKEREKLQNRLAQTQKMEALGTLAGGIAHDFNNILTAIIGFAQIVKEEAEKGSPLEDDLNEIYMAGLRAKDLVAQILTFARQSAEDIKPVRVDIILKEVTKFIRSSIPTNIDIKSTIKSTAFIMGNQTKLHQVFMNLFTNAAQAMEANGGLLEISADDTQVDNGMISQYPELKSGDYIEIKVADTGVGIPNNIMDSIFEPYFTTKDDGEGTGLGLSVVQGIIESYGGKIFVSSELGKGTVFTLFLPVTKRKETLESDESENQFNGTERILLIDDEPSIVKMSQKILEALGYNVTTRTNSADALELFKSKPEYFDLVITDMTMPGLTGDQLAQSILEIRPNFPIILCSGYSKKLSVNPALVSQLKAVLNKPIAKIDFAKTVREVLDKTDNT